MVGQPIKKTPASHGVFAGARHPIKKTPSPPGAIAGVRQPIQKTLPPPGVIAGVQHPVKKTQPPPSAIAGSRHPIKKTPPGVQHPIKKTPPSIRHPIMKTPPPPSAIAGIQHPIFKKNPPPPPSATAGIRHPIENIPSPPGIIAGIRHLNKKILPLPGVIAGVRNPIKKTTQPSGAIAGVRHLIKTTPPPPSAIASIHLPIKKTPPPHGAIAGVQHPIKKTLLPPGVIAGENNFFHSHCLHKLQAQDPIGCKVCDKFIDGEAYGCNILSCKFYIHKTCFKLPRTIQHNSHTASSLKLRARSLYVTGSFICNACGESGDSFHYHSIDKFDLHVGCAALPGSLTPELYLVKLLYSFPLYREALTTKCKVCTQAFPSNCWVYYDKIHRYIYHLKCAIAGNESTAIEIQQQLNMIDPKRISSSSSAGSLLSSIFKQ